MKQYGTSTFGKTNGGFSPSSPLLPAFTVFARQPPATDDRAIHAAMLVTILAQHGAKTATVSEQEASYASFEPDFGTRKRFETSRKAFEARFGNGDAHVIVYASSLQSPTSDHDTLRARFLRNRRRILLPLAASWRARSTTIVFDTGNIARPAFWNSLLLAAALAFTRFRRLRIVLPGSAPVTLAKKLGITAPEPVSRQTAIEHAFRLARQHRETLRLGPDWLDAAIERERNAGADDRLLRDIRDIAHLCRSIGNGARQAMRAFDYGVGDAGADRQSEKRRQSMTPRPGEVLPPVVSHFRHSLPDNHGVPARALKHDSDFLEWYIHNPKARNHIPALPLPEPEVTRISRTLHTPSAKTLDLLLSLARRGDSLAALPRATADFFATPVGQIAGNLSRMELICAVLAGIGISTRDTGEKPWQSGALRSWYQGTLCTKLPALARFSTSDGTELPVKQPEIVVSGIVSGHSGLAINAAMHAETFKNIGFDVSLQSGAPNRYRSGCDLPVRGNRPLLRRLVLHNDNAARIPLQILSREAAHGDAVHAGFLLWELPQTPRSHQLAGELLDDIWVPSGFVQDIYQRAYGRTVHNVGKYIDLPDAPPADLGNLGIQARHKLFLVVFDAHSMVERKNPLASVLAFLDAFPDNPDVRLLVKTTPAPKSNRGDPDRQMQTILHLAKHDPRIVVEQTILPFRSLLARIRRADCLVSPHRAEGFGYIPAYALYFGKPVIVTDYSGTQDFCTVATSFPVPCRMTEVPRGAFITDIPDAVWADIDRDALARAMQQVINNPAEAAARAAAGQRLIREHYNPQRHVQRIAERLVELGVMEN